MLIVEFADLKIGRADERYSASMAEYPPKPLRPLYCGRGAGAFNRLTSGNAAINEIERQCHEKRDFSHRSPLCVCRDDRTVQEFEFEPWLPDGLRQGGTPNPPLGAALTLRRSRRSPDTPGHSGQGHPQRGKCSNRRHSGRLRGSSQSDAYATPTNATR
jgi:hypothetical protein